MPLIIALYFVIKFNLDTLSRTVEMHKFAKIQTVDESELKTKKKKETGEDSKQIVESASQVIGSMNKKLESTLKELEVVKQILEKEKYAHNKLKKKIQS